MRTFVTQKVLARFASFFQGRCLRTFVWIFFAKDLLQKTLSRCNSRYEYIRTRPTRVYNGWRVGANIFVRRYGRCMILGGFGSGGAGGASAPPKKLICWKFGQNLLKFGQILENLGKIPENPNKIPKFLEKIPENLGKSAAQRCFTSKNSPPTFAKKQVKTIFWKVTLKNGRKKLHKNFLGKFGKIWAKILCTPKNFDFLKIWAKSLKIRTKPPNI